MRTLPTNRSGLRLGGCNCSETYRELGKLEGSRAQIRPSDASLAGNTVSDGFRYPRHRNPHAIPAVLSFLLLSEADCAETGRF